MARGTYFETMAEDKSFFEGRYPKTKHRQAKARIRKLVRDGFEDISFYDGSGWQVRLLPKKNKYCTPSGCSTLEKGLNYIQEADGGMVDTWEWKIFAHKRE